MNPTTYSPSCVHELFRSLLGDVPAATSAPRPSVSTTHEPLTGPPPKNSIRYIENDQNNRREKYDGHRWRLACTWHAYDCPNLAYTRQLCAKHNAQQQNKALPKRKRRSLLTTTSLPILNNHNRKSTPPDDYGDDDDDIQIIEELYKQPTIRHSMSSNVKWEAADFNVFSVEHVNESHPFHTVKSEPTASTAYQPTSSADIEYVSSSTRANGVNVPELVSKSIPPLTEFEEDYIATRLMEKFPTNSSMLDVQLFLHNEAIAVVKRNYRLTMDKIAPEYFFDFLLRHPRVALHFTNWFSRCKPSPPTTGCPIDTKVWTLSMIVRGANTTDHMTNQLDD